MKTLIFSFVLLVITQTTNAQDDIKNLFDTLPKIKPTQLTQVQEKYQFKTNKWTAVQKTFWVDLFAIENDKFWTGQQVADVRILGWWRTSENSIAYVYNVKLPDANDNLQDNVFISSYNTLNKRKGVDHNPFNLLPSPTGMRGKVINTKILKINSMGLCEVINMHKGTAKTLSKTKKFTINAYGSLEEK
jgi:hypothetical protein